MQSFAVSCPSIPAAFGLIASVAIALGSTAAARVSEGASPLNVLVVVADDVGVDQVGCYAANYTSPSRPQPCTPRLDQLAAEGMRFTNAWGSPICTPMRALLLTGKRARHTGVGSTTNFSTPAISGLQVYEDTIASVLRSARPGGWAVALGKWHVADPTQGCSHPTDVGFNSFSGSLYNLTTPQDLSYGDWHKSWAMQGSCGSYQVQTYATVDTTDDAIGFLQSLPEPWLLYVAYNSSHRPFHCPSDPDPKRTTEGTFPCPANSCPEGWCSLCTVEGQCQVLEGSSDACKVRAMTEALDSEIGRILDTLDATGIRSRTAILVMSDNGTPQSATVAPWKPTHAKATPYQGGINVPLIAWTPSMAGGSVRHELVSASDVYASVLDLLEVPLAARPVDPNRDSVSLAQYLDPARNVGGDVPRAFVYSEVFAPNYVPDGAGNPPIDYLARYHYQTLRNATHKLIAWHDGVTPLPVIEFYELSAGPGPADPAFGPDPFEATNLFDPITSTVPPAHLAAFTQLSQELAASHPPLPTRRTIEIAPAAVVSARRSSAGEETCSTTAIRVSHASEPSHSLGPLDNKAAPAPSSSERAFFDFDLSFLPAAASFVAAELDVDVVSPALATTTRVEVRGVACGIACYPGCQGIFGSVTASTYAVEPAWTLSGVRTIALSPAALVDLGAALAGTGTFATALRLQQERAGFEDQIDLTPLASLHRLRVTYELPGTLN